MNRENTMKMEPAGIEKFYYPREALYRNVKVTTYWKWLEPSLFSKCHQLLKINTMYWCTSSLIWCSFKVIHISFTPPTKTWSNTALYFAFPQQHVIKLLLSSSRWISWGSDSIIIPFQSCSNCSSPMWTGHKIRSQTV